MHFKLSSAICFNLDQSKILWSGNGLTLAEVKILASVKFKGFAGEQFDGGSNFFYFSLLVSEIILSIVHKRRKLQLF